MNKFINFLTSRKFIDDKASKNTYVQIFGCILILLGIITIFIYNCKSEPSGIAISFFITMLGVAFAFPKLLEGNDGLSTMRIVVFMMINVICMLLLKIGWTANSLTEIGLNGSWMGVIAFVFGAKATQSYFESKFAVPENTPVKVGVSALEFTNAEIAKLAVEQNQQYLKVKFPNIVCISDAVNDLNDSESHVVVLYLKDNNIKGIPDSLNVELPGKIKKTIATEIIQGVSEGKIQFGNGDSITDINSSYNPSDSVGSICCAVQSVNNPAFFGIITCAHIYTHGDYNENDNTVLVSSMQRDVYVNNAIVGKWFYKQMHYSQDLIIAELIDKSSLDPQIKFNNQYYTVSDLDVKNHSSKVTVLSKENKRTEAFILDYNVGYPFRYENGTFYKKDIILIGNVPDRSKSKPISEKGDSGSCVFITGIDDVTQNVVNKMVGILIGANENFTFVLPIQSTLSPNFKII